MAYPLPVILEASSNWIGNDGNWSSFNIFIGSPPQQFYVLPSTTAGESWVPVPEGCATLLSADFNCGKSRGVGFNNGVQSSGFLTNSSSTWQDVGLYSALAEQALFGNTTAVTYGQDLLTLPSRFAQLNLPRQLIGGMASWDFWTGTLGLGSSPTHFDVRTTPSMGVIQSLQASGNIASSSYGFFAGAWYSKWH